MAEQHRATAEQWQGVKENNDLPVFSCILELRDRIKALEAPQSGSIDLSHLSDGEREKMARWIANPGTFEVLEVAQPAQPNHPAKPDSSLQAAIIEAERFLDSAKELHMQLAHVDWIHVRGNAASSNVLRASTDLTRALDDLRRAER